MLLKNSLRSSNLQANHPTFCYEVSGMSCPVWPLLTWLDATIFNLVSV